MKDDKKLLDHEKPHYYGKQDGVHLFHARGDSHHHLVGHHVEHPSDADLKDAIKAAKEKKLQSVIIHGAPPPTFLMHQHQDIGPVKKLKKAEEQAVDEIKSLRDRLRSLLGDKDLAADFNEKHPAFDETDEDEAQEKKEFEQAGPEKRERMKFDELNELEEQIKAVYKEVKGGESKHTISAKEIIPGMLHPETHCDACDNPSEKCVCFAGLPTPRLEFDGRKVTVFFKSEFWSEESREAFLEDFKYRAGRLLRQKF